MIYFFQNYDTSRGNAIYRIDRNDGYRSTGHYKIVENILYIDDDLDPDNFYPLYIIEFSNEKFIYSVNEDLSSPILYSRFKK